MLDADSLVLALRSAAAGQIALALLSLALPRLLGWRPALAELPLLIREVFHVHALFIAVTCALFGVLTWRFASELATAESLLARWLAAGIALFWGLRTVLQISYYSVSHWRGQAGRTTAHIAFLVFYGGLTALYATAAFGAAP